MYYSKDFLISAPPSQEDVQKYLDLVPFASVSYRVYKLQIGHRLVVINRDFYEGLKNVLLSLGFSIVSVVPGFIITGTGTTSSFSSQTCLLINRKMDIILENSFGGQETPTNVASSSREFIERHKITMAVIVLIVIVACPLFLYFYYQKQKAAVIAKKPRPVATAPVRKVTPAPSPTVSPYAQLKLEQYSLQILNGSGVSGLTASLEGKFRALGFTQISTGNFTKTSATTIIYNAAIPKSVRDLIQSVLSPLFKNISSKDSNQAQFDINITTGNITP